MRLVAANWLSVNIVAYAIALVLLCCILGICTSVLLSRLGRRIVIRASGAAAVVALVAAVAGVVSAAAAGFERHRPPADWAAYRDRFVLPDGRVVDDANGGISHSESQGYGLLLAFFGRRPRHLRAHLRFHPQPAPHPR